MTGIQQRIHRIFIEDLKVDVPSADLDLFETAALDSLGFVELLVRIEEAFGRKVSLDEVDLADFRSIARIAAWLSRSGATA